MHQVAGLVGEDAGGYVEAVVEDRGGAEVEMRIDGAEAGVGGSVNKAGDAGVDDGSGAHHAGFDGGVERGAGQAIVLQLFRGLADGEYLGVSGRVAVGDRAVRRRGEQRAFGGNDARPDGNFADGGCVACRFEGDVHPMFVRSFHQKHFIGAWAIWEEDGDRGRLETGDWRRETRDKEMGRKGVKERRRKVGGETDFLASAG